MWRSRPALFSWLHMTPDDEITATEERSYRPGSASRCSSIGWANAWPTITMFVARWRSAAANSSATSKWRLTRVTTAPPRFIAMSAENCPVPCISGQATSITGPSGPSGSARSGELGDRRCGRSADERVAPGPEHVEQIVLAPHHPLGDAGRAAGVEEQQVVPAAGGSGRGERRPGRGGGLVRRRPLRAGSGVVRDGVPPLDLAEAGPDAVEQLAEPGVEHHRLGVGVVEEVHELVAAVAVVGVDRDHRRLERGDHRLHVLGAVVEVAGHLGLVPEPTGHEVGGERRGPPIDVAPRDHPLAVDQAGPVRDAGGDRLVHVSEVPTRRHRRQRMR